jgi:AraC-like DNA-binding protein
MSILYCDEHTACSNYLPNNRIGFRCIDIEKGEIISEEESSTDQIFFILKGGIKIRYNEFNDKIFQAKEMFFLPKSADYNGEAVSNSKIIILNYHNNTKLCDKFWTSSVVNQAQTIIYEFKSLSIKNELNLFFDLLLCYLNDRLNCSHLQKIKQREFLLVLRAYYTKEELAQFFFPILGKSMDFRGKVMEYYRHVKTSKELAKFCGYSESRFSELFVEEFGSTPYQWIQKQKAKHIIGKLHQKHIPLKEIADEFHFSCPSHFNKYCKAQYGDSAAQIRKKLNTEMLDENTSSTP